MNLNIRELSISSVRSGLLSKSFSAREVAAAYLEEARNKNPKIFAYTALHEEEAMRAADRIDSASAEEMAGMALAGVPVAVKDNILVSSERATAGSRILEPYISAYEATAVSRLKAAGAVILGKTNQDEFAMGSSTENSAFGITKNPHDQTRVPGGSSGGSAAAVAADMALAALGSDTGGSIRQPAAFTGVVGFKPTYGRVSRHGLIAMASSLDQIGPLAKSVEDAAHIYRAIAGRDRYDATTVPHPVLPLLERDLKGIKIGIPEEYFAEGLDGGIKDAVESAIKKFESAGALTKRISLKNTGYGLATYYIVMPAEVSANLARFDGLRYGYRKEGAGDLMSLYKETRDEGFGAEVKRRIMIGTYVLSHGYYDAYYVKAEKVRQLIRDDFESAFKEVDVIMGPTTPAPAFPIGAKTKDPVSMYLEDIYTVSINLSGVPAISIPCGATEENGSQLPVGLQIIGNWFDEANLLGIASAAEKILRL